MKGNVLTFDPDTRTGAIGSQDDGKRYDFALGDWRSFKRPQHGDVVDFLPDGQQATKIFPIESEDKAPKTRALPFNLAPVIIVGLGAFLVLVSLFMPNLTSGELQFIKNNMVIENDPVIALAVVAAVISVIRFWNVGSKSSANLSIYVGMWFFGWTIFDAFHSQLHRIGCDSCLVDTSPGAGLWAGGLGSLIIALGGLMMRFPNSGFGLVTGPVMPLNEQQSMMTQTKICPRCAETVKAAAVVCRYCQHEFE